MESNYELSRDTINYGALLGEYAKAFAEREGKKIEKVKNGFRVGSKGSMFFNTNEGWVKSFETDELWNCTQFAKEFGFELPQKLRGKGNVDYKVRLDGKESKTFRFFHIDPVSQKVVLKKKGLGEELPFHCHDTPFTTNQVLVVEGEKTLKSAQKLTEHTVVTCSSNSPSKTDFRELTNKTVYIFPDKDKTGISKANQYAEEIFEVTPYVFIVEPPDTWEEKDDIADHPKYFLTVSLDEYVKTHSKKYTPKKVLSGGHSMVLKNYLDIKDHYQNVTFLVQGLMPQVSTSIWFGAYASGKSYIGLDFAWHVSCGRNWCGRQTEKKAVVVVVGEGFENVIHRIKALSAVYEEEPQSLFVMNEPISLNKPESLELIDSNLEEIDKEGFDIGLVIFDTLAKTMSGNENSAQDTGDYVKGMTAISNRYECSVITIHHIGKNNEGKSEDNLYRGSSALPSNVDNTFYISMAEDPIKGAVACLKPIKFKSGLATEEIYFQFDQIDIGIKSNFDIDTPISYVYHSDKDQIPELISLLEAKQKNDSSSLNATDRKIIEALRNESSVISRIKDDIAVIPRGSFNANMKLIGIKDSTYKTGLKRLKDKGYITNYDAESINFKYEME